MNEWIKEGTNTWPGIHSHSLQPGIVCYCTGQATFCKLLCSPHTSGAAGVTGPYQGQLELSFQISLLCSADVKFMPWNSKKENNGILFHWLFKICSVPKGWIYKHYWKCGTGCQEFLSFVSAWARIRLLLLQIRGLRNIAIGHLLEILSPLKIWLH